MEPKLLVGVQKHDQQEVIHFKWEPVRKNPKRYGELRVSENSAGRRVFRCFYRGREGDILNWRGSKKNEL
jgi:hypothetical protein